MRKVILLSLFIAMVSVSFEQTKSYASGDHKIPEKTLHAIGEGLSHVLTFEPFNPPLKNHLWMETDSGKMSFFHFAKATSMGDNKLLFMGDAIKGKFCLENQPDEGKTGYVHFHSLEKADGHKHGHGGVKGQDGYWLRHIAVGEFEAMGIKFKPGIAHNFKATPAPKCK
ncbi:MAG: hypothetical protein ACE5FY_05135 [Nitrospiria bacterium]